MTDKYYHYTYEVQDAHDGYVEGVVTVHGTDETKAEVFTRSDVADTYPDGVLQKLVLQDVTDAEGQSVL